MLSATNGGRSPRNSERRWALGGSATRAAPSVEVDRDSRVRNENRRITDTLLLARSELDMDIALLSDVSKRRPSVLAAVGQIPSLAVCQPALAPLEEIVALRVLEQGVSVIHDAACERRLRDLAIVRREAGVRSCIGAGLGASGGPARLLWCLDRRPRPDLGDRDVRFLTGLAETLRLRLDGL